MRKEVRGYVDTAGSFYSAKGLDSLMFSGGTLNGDVYVPRYSLSFLRGLYEDNTYHATCVRVKAEDVAGNGYSLHALGSDDVYDKKLVDNLLLRLDIQGNTNKAVVDMQVFGYGFFEVIRAGNVSGGKIIDIKHVESDTVQVCKDKMRFVQKVDNVTTYFKAYGSDVNLNSKTGKVMKDTDSYLDRATELYMFKKYSVLDKIYGETDVIQAVKSLAADQARRVYMLKFLQNYAVPAYALIVTGDYEDKFDEQGNSMLDKMLESYVESLRDNPYSTMVLKFRGSDIQVRLEEIGGGGKDADFRQFALDVRDEIVSAHRVPPSRIGIEQTGALGGSVAEEATKVYASSVIAPIQNLVNSFVNNCVLASWGLDSAFEFKLNGLETDMAMEELTFLLDAVDRSVLSAEEMRALIAYKYNLK